MNSPLCFYCKKVTRYVMDDHTRSSAWQCDWHGAVRVRHNPPLQTGGGHNVSLVVLYKEQRYHAIFYYDYEQLVTPKFRLDKVNRRPRTDQVILSLDFHPDITPENIASKLPTYIMFS